MLDEAPNPGADTLTVVGPGFAPVTVGWTIGCVCPAAIVIAVGVMLNRDMSLLNNVTVAPPAGAGIDKLIGNGTD